MSPSITALIFPYRRPDAARGAVSDAGSASALAAESVFTIVNETFPLASVTPET